MIQPPKSGVELELYPRNLRLMKHTITPQHHGDFFFHIQFYVLSTILTIGSKTNLLFL